MSITTECMTVNLQIGIWMGHRLDKEATRKVTTEASADADAARVNKHIVPKESLKDIQSAATAVRSHFYERTLPWKDNGDRLLTRTMYLPFMEENERLIKAFYAARDTFIGTIYPSLIERAAFRMGELFNPNDYPKASALRDKFYVTVDYDAVTEAGDFRVAIDDASRDQLKQVIAESMQARIGRAMQDVWERLQETVGHFATKMADSDAVFRDSTVRNLEALVELIPGLNVLNDPNLAQVTEDIKATIVGYDPKQLRTDKASRAVAASEASRILQEMAGFTTAFAGMTGEDA